MTRTCPRSAWPAGVAVIGGVALATNDAGSIELDRLIDTDHGCRLGTEPIRPAGRGRRRGGLLIAPIDQFDPDLHPFDLIQLLQDLLAQFLFPRLVARRIAQGRVARVEVAVVLVHHRDRLAAQLGLVADQDRADRLDGPRRERAIRLGLEIDERRGLGPEVSMDDGPGGYWIDTTDEMTPSRSSIQCSISFSWSRRSCCSLSWGVSTRELSQSGGLRISSKVIGPT